MSRLGRILPATRAERVAARVAIPTACAGLCLACGLGGDAYRPEPWMEDLDVLEAHMGLVYANLEWNVEHRGLELPELDRRTRDSIREARSDADAADALEEFVRAFDDPHFGIESRRPPWIAWAFRLFENEPENRASEPLAAGASGEEACEALGYRDRGRDFEFGVDRLPDWSRLPDDEPFPAGTFALPDGARAGILRIEHFGENGYRAQCVEAWESERRVEPCDDVCLSAFRRRASDALANRVARRVEALEAAGATVLVVDVTGNGGGSEWVDPVTRIFSARPLRSMRAATVRHPRSIDPTERRLAAVEAALAGSSLPASSRELLEVARARLAAELSEARAPCDRAPLWRGADPGCSQLFGIEAYATGVFDWLSPGALAGVDPSLAEELYSPFGRDVPAGVWTGPLFVLADGGSASATEAFVAMLKDNKAATVIGERTFGAGCGFLDGGLPLELPNSGLEVWMPDCARFRIDGTNEIEGIEPDVPLAWSNLRGSERAEALVAALARSPGR
jgi:hypothetical protein